MKGTGGSDQTGRNDECEMTNDSESHEDESPPPQRTQSRRAEQLALFPDYELPVDGRRARNEFTAARLRAKRRWENYQRCLVRNPDLSFPEFLKNPEFADLRS